MWQVGCFCPSKINLHKFYLPRCHNICHIIKYFIIWIYIQHLELPPPVLDQSQSILFLWRNKVFGVELTVLHV